MPNLSLFLPFIVIIGVMFLMTRSAKNKQRQAVEMRNQMQPGSGVRTIGGMYATVKEVHPDTVLLEVAPGVHAIYAKNAIGAVLEDEEYNRIVHGEGQLDSPVVPDDASELIDVEAPAVDDAPEEPGIDLGKSASEQPASEDAAPAQSKEGTSAQPADDKSEGDAEAK